MKNPNGPSIEEMDEWNDELRDREAERGSVQRVVGRLIDAVPQNWCDALLTGKDGIGQPPYTCRHIEQLLRGVQDRMRAIRDSSNKKGQR
jgi:hypothetical protein